MKIISTIAATAVTAGVLLAPLPAIAGDDQGPLISRLYDRLDSAHDRIDCLEQQNKDLRAVVRYERHSAGKPGRPLIAIAGPTDCAR